jgi:hypothetical protein
MALPNIQFSDKFRVVFSNIPGFKPNNLDNYKNFDLYELYIKSVNFPGLDVSYTESDYLNYHINHPISRINQDLSDLSITFKLSEDMLNYHYLYSWIHALRNQKNIDGKKFFRQNMIDDIKIIFLDNEKREKVKYIYTNCFISNISSLSLEYGTADEMTFEVSFKIEDYNVEFVEECR